MEKKGENFDKKFKEMNIRADVDDKYWQAAENESHDYGNKKATVDLS